MKRKSNLFLRSLPLFPAIILAGAFAPPAAMAQTWNQTGAGTYSWNDNANWSGAFPNAADAVANLNLNFTANQTINLNEPITVGTIHLGDTGSTFFTTTIAPNSGSLIMDVASGSALISKATAAHNVTDTISAGIQLNDNLIVNNAATSTSGLLVLSGIISESGSKSLTKNGAGIVRLSEANSYTGLTTISQGTLQLFSNTGSLDSSSGLTFNGGGGTFNMDNNGAGASRSQSLGAMTFSAGDGTVLQTRTAAQNQLLTFASLASRTAGATGNFTLSSGTASTSNGFILTGVTADTFIDKGIFFGTSATSFDNYAWYDNTGFVRAMVYGTDTGAVTSGATTTLAGATHQQITGAISAQNTATFTTFKISGANNLTLAASQTVTLDGILKAGNNASIISGGTGIQASNNAELVIRTNEGTLTINNSILANGTNALTKTGAGTLTLGVANSYSGGTTLNAGTLTISNAGALGGGTFTLNGGTVSVSSLTLSGAIPIVINGDWRTTTSNSGATFNTGTGGITLNAPVTINVTNSQLNLGGAITSPGSVYNALDISFTRSDTQNAGATFTSGILLRGDQVANTSSIPTVTYSSPITDGGNNYGLTFSSPTTYTLNGLNSFTGALVINSGSTVVLNAAGTIKSTAVTINTGGTLSLGLQNLGATTAKIDTTSTILNNGVLRIGDNVAYVQGTDFPSGISGTGSVAITGNRIIGVTLSGVNTYSGGTTLGNGGDDVKRLNINSATAIGSGALTITSGTSRATINNTSGGPITLSTNNTQDWNGSFTFTGSNALDLGTGTVTLANSPTLTVSASTLTVGGAIGGNLSTNLTKSGAGTLLLSGNSTFGGELRVQQGFLSIGTINDASTNGVLGNSGNAVSLGNSGNVTGTLQYTGANASSNKSFAMATGGTGAFQIDSGGTTLTLSGLISGAGNLSKTGAGTLTLSGANTFTGTTTVSAGALHLANNLAIANSALVTTGAGTLTLGTGITTPTFGGLSGASGNLASVISSGYGDVTNLTLNPQGTSILTYSGAIDNGATGMTLTKTGSGTQILSGTNGYTGDTSVSNGLLRINGSLASDSDVTVTAGYIGGTGSINGSVALNSIGGIDLRDGAIGTLTIGGNLAINGSAGANNLYFDLGTGGTTDQIVVDGNVTMANAGAGVINFNQLSGGRVTAGSYNLIQATGTMPDLSNFSLVTTAAFGSSFTLGVSGNDLQVTTTQLPAGPAAAFWSGATDGNWSTAGNWNTTVAGGVGTGAAPSYQSNVTFSTTTPGPLNLTNTLDTDFDINSLTFNNASGGVTIGGTKTLTIEATNANGNTAGNGIIASAQTSGTNTINANLGIAANQSWNIGTGGTLTVGGNVTDYGGGRTLTKRGTGTLNLNGSTTVGNLHVGFNALTGSVVVGSGGVLSVGYGPASSLLVGVNVTTGTTTHSVLDVSNATNFMTNVGNLYVGVCATGLGSPATAVGTLKLGNSNITAQNIVIGGTEPDGNSGAGNGGIVTVASGTTSTILSPVMAVGTTKSNLGGIFALLGSGATLNLGTSDSRTSLYVGRHLLPQTGNPETGVMNLAAGNANLYLSSLYLAKNINGTASGSSTTNGTLALSDSASNLLDISGPGNVVQIGYYDGTSGFTVNGNLSVGNLGSQSAITSTDNSTAILLAYRPNGTCTGTLSLNSGTLTITTTGAGIAGGGGTSTLKLNGTTLKAGASSSTFISNLTNAHIYGGGLTLDSNSNAITVSQALVTAPGGGFGLAMTNLTPTNGGSGYTTPPTVSFSTPGGGTAATGVATINAAGQVTGIVITNPGSGYTNGGSATISLSGGGGTGATFTTPTATVAQTGGGLTKSGAGTLTLGGANTYTGATLVSGGTLALGATASLNTSGIELEAGTSFDTTAQSYVMPTAKPFTLHLDSAGAGSSGKIKAASLDITDATVEVVIDGDDLDDPVYVLAEYTSLTGAEFDSITAPPTGYLIDYNYNSENKIAWVQEAGGDDYADWDDEYLADLSDKNGDEDGDGLSNFQEYAFGLNPISGASVNPITDISDLKTLGQFTYTRRVGTGLDYTIWTSTTLLANEWDEDTTADQEAGAPVDGVETVLVTLSEIPTSDKLFIRVKAD